MNFPLEEENDKMVALQILPKLVVIKDYESVYKLRWVMTPVSVDSQV